MTPFTCLYIHIFNEENLQFIILITIISLVILIIMTSGAHANKYFNRSHILFKIFDSKN
jgi:hypothetical protein